jgi:SAM-dependent methyltransferase
VNFRDYFSDRPEIYSKYRPTYPVALFEYLASIAPSRELAWDCGTGNGQAAVKLAYHFKQVIATDLSARQIENAFPHEKVDYRVEPAEHTSISARSVDLITCAIAVHWFEFDRFYNEVRRVGKPGGILAVFAYHLPTIEPKIDRSLERYNGEILQGYWPGRIRYNDERYRTLPFPFEEIQPPYFEMRAEWDLKMLAGFLDSWSATQYFMKEKGYHPLDEIAGELEQNWGDKDRVRRIRWPLHLRIGRLPG